MSTNDVIALAIIDFWQLPTAATSLGKVLKVPFTFARLLSPVYSPIYSIKMKIIFKKFELLIDPFTVYPLTPLCSLKKDL